MYCHDAKELGSTQSINSNIMAHPPKLGKWSQAEVKEASRHQTWRNCIVSFRVWTTRCHVWHRFLTPCLASKANKLYSLNQLASVGVISRTFRKLWSTVKVREAIFSRFCVIIALWAYIRPWNFFPDSSYSFDARVKMAKNAREYPMG